MESGSESGEERKESCEGQSGLPACGAGVGITRYARSGTRLAPTNHQPPLMPLFPAHPYPPHPTPPHPTPPRSWNIPRAIKYREINKITGLKGTAVNVQTMVYGNMGESSGTGVCFTRNPANGASELFGEFLINAQVRQQGESRCDRWVWGRTVQG